MDVVGASHVSFSVSDLERSLEWYRRVFRAEIMMREPGDVRSAVVLTLPNTTLGIGLVHFAGGDHAPFSPEHVGLDHFAFRVEQEQKIHDWAAHLSALGVEHSGVIPIPPGAILNFKDPDGIALAVLWWR